MEYKTLINDIKIPVLGLGTWGIGGMMESDYSNDRDGINIIKTAIGLGYTHIDTAEMYGSGHTEELVGEAIQGFNRRDIFITTKVKKTHLKYEDLIHAAKMSIERLHTHYIDLYLIHEPSDEIPIQESMKALDYLVENKLVKYIGVSNFQSEQLIEAQKYTKNKIVANQIEYSLLTRNTGRYSGNKDMETKTIPYCQKNGIIIMAERPIERGLLLENHPVLDTLEKKYHKTKAQIAINWLISKKNIITMPKSTNKDHLIENLGSYGWKLDDTDMRLLDTTDFGSTL